MQCSVSLAVCLRIETVYKVKTLLHFSRANMGSYPYMDIHISYDLIQSDRLSHPFFFFWSVCHVFLYLLN